MKRDLVRDYFVLVVKAVAILVSHKHGGLNRVCLLHTVGKRHVSPAKPNSTRWRLKHKLFGGLGLRPNRPEHTITFMVSAWLRLKYKVSTCLHFYSSVDTPGCSEGQFTVYAFVGRARIKQTW